MQISIRLSLWLIGLGTFLGAPVLQAGPGPDPGAFQRLLNKLPNPGTRCGAMIVDLKDGTVVFSQSADEAMIPASNQKLITLAAAVDQLGPQWSFRTVLAKRGADLLLIGDGDPALGDPKLAEKNGELGIALLDRWAAVLLAAGLERIPGDLVIDASVFDDQYFHPDWNPTDQVKWYGAPVGGLNFNDNCVEVTVWPGESANALAQWSIYPPCPIAEVVNSCRTTSGGKAQPIIARRADGFKLVLQGTVAKRATLQSVSVADPTQFTAHVLRAHLAAKNVRIAGKVRFERVRTESGGLPEDCTVLAEQVTPLPDLLGRIGQDSQNLFAECMFKRLGYEWSRGQAAGPARGSWETGRSAVAVTLTRAGCKTERCVVADASGLSRKNRIAAADFVAILKYMYQHPQRDLFVNSLAGNRTGGSLKRRMKDMPGDVYAKTGYMQGIRTLSGYVRTQDDHWYAFSVLFNGFPGSSGPYNVIHDKICRLLAGGSATSKPKS